MMGLANAIEMMGYFAPSIAATKKVKGGLPEGFAWYSFWWLDDSPNESGIMRVQGSMTRIAKSGKNKGQPIVARGEKKKTVYVTAAEINAAEAAANQGNKNGGAA